MWRTTGIRHHSVSHISCYTSLLRYSEEQLPWWCLLDFPSFVSMPLVCLFVCLFVCVFVCLQAWGAARCVSKDDWMEWLRRLSVELLKESPSPSLRSCWATAQSYPPLARCVDAQSNPGLDPILVSMSCLGKRKVLLKGVTPLFLFTSWDAIN